MSMSAVELEAFLAQAFLTPLGVVAGQPYKVRASPRL